MAFIWLWFAAPFVLVAGSRPAGQSPANPADSSTVRLPPDLAAPDAVELDELDELPHAVTATARRPISAAVAASFHDRMPRLILHLSSLGAAVVDGAPGRAECLSAADSGFRAGCQHDCQRSRSSKLPS